MKSLNKKNHEPKKILITGGAGYIGNTLIQSLPNDCQIYVLDNYHIDTEYKRRINERLVKSKKVTFIKANASDIGLFKNLLKDIDTVIYMASLNSVRESEKKPQMYLRENNLNLQKFLDVLSKNAPNVRKMILTSTRGVYGEGNYYCLNCKKQVTPVTAEILTCINCGSTKVIPRKTGEDSKLVPGSIYGLSKRIQEDLISLYCTKKGITLDIFRIFNIFGEDQEKYYLHIGIIPMLFSLIKEKKEITLSGSGKIYRDFIHIKDAVSVIKDSVYSQNKRDSLIQHYNLGTGKAISVNDICKFFSKKGYKFRVNLDPLFKDIKYSVADNSKLVKTFKVKKFRTLNSYLNNYYKNI